MRERRQKGIKDKNRSEAMGLTIKKGLIEIEMEESTVSGQVNEAFSEKALLESRRM